MRPDRLSKLSLPASAQRSLQRLRSERARARSAAHRAGVWPGQPGWLGCGRRQALVFLYRAAARAIGGRTLGRLPFNWISSVAAVRPHAGLGDHIKEITAGSVAQTTEFPPGPAGFEWFTRSISSEATSDFVAHDVMISPRSGLVWIEDGPVLGESYGSQSQLLSWGYAAHDLRAAKPPVTLATDRPVLCVPSSGYFHVVLESLPALLRVAERGDPFDILVWSGAPAYVRELAELLQQGADAGEIVEASGPVRARRVRVAGRTALSGHFDDLDLARLRTFGNRTPGPGARAAAERIFVTRTGASRILGNEADVAEHLVRSGFAVVDPGRHPIPEQITMFKGARTVVGAHGGGLTNLAWCPAGTAVVEIFRPERNQDCYARLSHLAGLRYRPQATTSSGHVDLADLSSTLRELTCG